MLKEWKFLDANCWSKVWESILYIIGKEGIKQPNKQTIDKESDTEWLLKGKNDQQQPPRPTCEGKLWHLVGCPQGGSQISDEMDNPFLPWGNNFPRPRFSPRSIYTHCSMTDILSTFFSECNSTKQIWNSRNNWLKHKENILAFPNGISIHEILNLSSL